MIALKKPLCLLLFSVLSTACYACAPNQQPSQTTTPSKSKITILPPQKQETPSQATTPSAPNQAFWQLDGVDTSDVCKNKKYIAFTFDDAPAKTLESIVTIFADYNTQNPDCPASATLFCNGILMSSAGKQTLQLAHQLGFELGNHSYSHADLTLLTPERLQTEIDHTDALLSQIDGNPKHLFRAPFGSINEQVKHCVQAPILHWTIDTLDWTGATADNIFSCVWEKKFDGAIVLMHDGYEGTMYALKRLLPALKAENYQVLSVSKMAKANFCKLKIGSVYIRARKNGAG